jgi:hypothetical protein
MAGDHENMSVLYEQCALKLKDSGTRDVYDSGAVRDGQEGKGRMDLLPVRALIEVSKVFEAGAKKYAARNWEKGLPLSRYMDSGLRHAFRWLKGDRDEPHLAMAIWNLLCLLDTQMRIADGLVDPALNDIPMNPIALGDKKYDGQESVLRTASGPCSAQDIGTPASDSVR